MTKTSWKVPLVALVFALAAGLSTTGCSDDPSTTTQVNTTTPDAGPGVDPDAGPGVDPDAGPGVDPDADAGDDPDADAPDADPDVDPGPDHPGANFLQAASGGGSMEGGGYRAVIGVGAPTPRGASAGGGYRIRLGLSQLGHGALHGRSDS